MRGKIALLFDRSYIDAQHCFMELAIQLAKNDFDVDLYMVKNHNNHQPFFEQKNIRIFPFPVSRFQQIEYWSKIIYSKDRKYNAIIGTPYFGAWISYKTAKILNIPYYYFADELITHIAENTPQVDKQTILKRNFKSNKHAIATIALGQERYELQKNLNGIDYPHDHIIIPNAPSGNTVKLKSNFYRDIFNLEDRKPILLFAGTLDWQLAKKIFEETKTYSERPYHIVFQTRSLGLMGNEQHPFIKISPTPIPASMLNYAFSSADIGLALYDKNSVQETKNGFTGGKIGTYLKNELPLITGSVPNLKFFEDQGVGLYWDGETDFDEIALKAINNIENYRKNISEFYKTNLQYDIFFKKFLDHLLANL